MSASRQLAAWRGRMDAAAADHRAATAGLAGARGRVAAADEHFYAAEEAVQIVQVVAETIQEAAHDRIAGVVSRCLAAVFDEPYEFQIQFERARNRTEARLVFIRGGEAVSPLDSSGGGVVDVAAFALRASCLMLTRPPARRVLVLDEPFRFVSADYRPRVAAMLTGLAEDLSTQFIMVTHFKELCCGEVVEVGA